MFSLPVLRSPKLRRQMDLVRSVAWATILVSSITFVSSLKYENCVIYASLLLGIYSLSYDTVEDQKEFATRSLINIKITVYSCFNIYHSERRFSLTVSSYLNTIERNFCVISSKMLHISRGIHVVVSSVKAL